MHDALTDRFGNPLAPGLPYARGAIVTSTQDDLRKLRRAWQVIEAPTWSVVSGQVTAPALSSSRVIAVRSTLPVFLTT